MEKHKKYISWLTNNGIFLLIFLFVWFHPHKGHTFDMSCWRDWAAFIKVNGLSAVYQSYTDYPPLIHHFFAFFAWFFPNETALVNHMHWFKVFTIFFDFLGLFIVFKWINRTADLKKYTALFILTIIYFYNTYLWGQVDAILSAFIILSIYFIYVKKNSLLSVLFFVLAINFKLQAIIFIPLLGILYLHFFLFNFTIKNFLKTLLLAIVVQFLILLPFLNDFDLVKNVILNSFDKYPVVSMNAFNFWDIVLVEDTFTLSDKTTFLGISYKNIGILLFFISSFFALFPLLYQVIKNKINQNQTNLSFNLVVLAYALIPVLFFYFNTQMHERYIHPAFLPIIAFSFYNKKYMLLFLFSIAYFLNLEYAAKFFAFNNYHTLIFEKEFVASIYAIILVILYRNIWLAFKKII